MEKIKIFKTFKFRLKDSCSKKILIKMSKDVNFVWNTTNEYSKKKWKESRQHLALSDLNKIVKGSSKYLFLIQKSVHITNREFLRKSIRYKKSLKFRDKKSLGWVPFDKESIKIYNGHVIYKKIKFKFWKSRDISGKFKIGSFNQDARGRWYINLVCEIEQIIKCDDGEIGIDLGLINTVADSNGNKISVSSYRNLEKKLSAAQRARKKRLVKTIHAKIKNKRKDKIEKYTTGIAEKNKLIFVGNVSSLKFIKTKMAKSVLDNSWGILKSRLSHKALMHGGTMIEVNEAYTSRTCSDCGSGWLLPKGLKSLAIREYTCPCCGTYQDRDINAARNILRIGHDSLLNKEFLNGRMSNCA